jgi:sugar lactone lactonase YvrE
MTLGADLVFAAGAELGEGPVWDGDDGVVLWVDIPAGRLHRTDPASGADRPVDLPQPVGAVVRQAGGYALAVRDGFAHLDAGDRFELVFDLAVPGVRMNDGKVAPDGSFWAGSMADPPHPGRGRLYRLAPGWERVEVALENLGISNGLAWSPDGRLLYFIDTPTRRVDRFDAEPGTARLERRSPVVELPSGEGNPDGMAIDSEGCLWVALAHSGRVGRFTPDGRLDAVVELPVPQVTSCCFGGDQGDVLFITTGRRGAAPGDRRAGGLFAACPGVSGPPPAIYGLGQPGA